MARYENILTSDTSFPVEVFMQNNLMGRVNVSEHFHDCFEVLYFMQGEALQIINGKQIIAKQNDIFLIKSGDIHATICSENEDCKILVFKFMPSILDIRYFNPEVSAYLASFYNFGTENELNRLSNEEIKTLQSILMDILKEYNEETKAYEIRIKGYIYEFVALLVRYELVNIPDTRATKRDMERMATILKYIEQHYNEPLALEDIVSRLNLNYSYVSRYFKRVIGKSFKSYLDYIRVCQAERIILNKNCYIYEAAEKCGFSSAEAFYRVYKRIRGATPSKILKR